MRTEITGALGLLVAAALAGGCYTGHSGDAQGQDGDDGDEAGEDGDDDGSDDGVDPDDQGGPFECDPNAVMASLSLRRLSKVQYENSLRDLLTWVGGEQTSWIFNDLATEIARVPDDARIRHEGETRGGFTRLDQAVHQEHIDGSYTVAVAAAEHLTSPELLAVTAGDCAVDGDASNDEACIDDFIRSFGERALRRPLDDEEVARYRARSTPTVRRRGWTRGRSRTSSVSSSPRRSFCT